MADLCVGTCMLRHLDSVEIECGGLGGRGVVKSFVGMRGKSKCTRAEITVTYCGTFGFLGFGQQMKIIV